MHTTANTRAMTERADDVSDVGQRERDAARSLTLGARRGSARRARRGFTLIEILVSISVVAVLVSLTLPGLARAREGAKQVQALSNIRTVGSSFAQYTDQYKTYPFLVPGRAPVGEASTPNAPEMPDDAIGVFWWPKGTLIATTSVWELAWLWPAPLSQMFSWEENYAMWVSVGRPRQLPESGQFLGDIQRTTSIRYSNSFIASPKVWNRSGLAQASEGLIRGMGIADVRYPAQKVLLWDADVTYLTRPPERVGDHNKAPTPMAFADGHAAALDPTQAKAPIQNPFQPQFAPMRLHDTENGLEGMDY